MPSSAEAAVVFLIVVIPGFLAMAGYRSGRAVPEHPEGLVATARVITISAVIVVIAWKLGGRAVYDHARTGTALTTHEAASYRLVVGLLLVPGMAGFVLGQFVDMLARAAGNARDNLPAPPTRILDHEHLIRRIWRGLLVFLTTRLLHEGPTTWDRTWKQMRRTQPYVFVRVRTKSGQEIVGTVAATSRIAVSPQPRDLYIEQVLRPGVDGKLYPTAYGLGIFVAGTEIEAVEWVSQEGVVTA
jgi:hypothetical protein